jgi:iron complex transport system substrate-binding protein
MTRRGVLAAATALATLAACSRGRRAPPDTGRVARRVVSVTPATTEALFAVGAGERVVGRSRFCDWPPEAIRLPAVGGIIDANFETIVQLEPDLVVGGPGPSSTTLASRLSALGIATWFPAIGSLDAIDVMILGMGDRTGHADQARRVVEDGRTRAAAVERAVAGEPAPRVLMVLDVGPVVAAGPGDFMDELLRRAGSVNVLASGGPWQALGFEEIAGLDPDVIVDASLADGTAASRVTAQAPGWKDVRAVRDGHVIAISDPRVLRPGPRVAQGLALLARALHPRADLPEP